MGDTLHRDTKHFFNVTFKSNERLDRNRERISNVTIFEVYPIYWRTMIIPGHAFIRGDMLWSGSAAVMKTGSATFFQSSTSWMFPSQAHSGSVVIFAPTSVCVVPQADPTVDEYGW